MTHRVCAFRQLIISPPLISANFIYSTVMPNKCARGENISFFLWSVHIIHSKTTSNVPETRKKELFIKCLTRHDEKFVGINIKKYFVQAWGMRGKKALGSGWWKKLKFWENLFSYNRKLRIRIKFNFSIKNAGRFGKKFL